VVELAALDSQASLVPVVVVDQEEFLLPCSEQQI
jgi:hypothetical protein